MSGEELVHIAPPPGQPVDGRGDWSQVERSLCALPDDYKVLVGAYGAGSFDHFIWVLSPFSKNQYLNLIEQAKLAREAHESLRRDFSEPPYYPFFPENSGLLPFGITDNGDYLYWKTAGSPKNWPVIIGAAREPKYEIFKCSVSEFLADILSRRITCNIFPADFPSDRPVFTVA